MQAAITSDTVPSTKLGAARQTKLLKCVGNVKFHGVRADALPGSDLAVAQPVSYSLDDPPFAGRQDVRMCRPSAISLTRHARSLSRPASNFPTQYQSFAIDSSWPALAVNAEQLRPMASHFLAHTTQRFTVASSDNRAIDDDARHFKHQVLPILGSPQLFL